MLCQQCKTNQASVHMQQFIGGQKMELNLCQDCAFKLGNPDMLVSLENIFKGLLEQLGPNVLPQGIQIGSIKPGVQGKPPQMQARAAKSCSRCGMTYNNFKKGGRLGCDECYKSFAKEVEVLFKNVQGSTRHEGKIPSRMGAQLLNHKHVNALRDRLKAAITEENYEEAAKLRDEIRAMENHTNAEVSE